MLYGAVCIFVVVYVCQCCKKMCCCFSKEPQSGLVFAFLLTHHTTKNHSSQTRGGLVFWYNYQTDKIITRRRCRETSNKCVVRWHFDLFFPPLSSRKNIGSTSSHPQKYFGRAASSLKLLVYGEKKKVCLLIFSSYYIFLYYIPVQQQQLTTPHML